ARIRLYKTNAQGEKCTFARTVGADQTMYASTVKLQRHVIRRNHSAVSLVQATSLKDNPAFAIRIKYVIQNRQIRSRERIRAGHGRRRLPESRSQKTENAFRKEQHHKNQNRSQYQGCLIASGAASQPERQRTNEKRTKEGSVKRAKASHKHINGHKQGLHDAKQRWADVRRPSGKQRTCHTGYRTRQRKQQQPVPAYVIAEQLHLQSILAAPFN